MTAALAVARRGMVPRTEGTFTLEQVEEVIREMHREPIIREGEQVITELRARLAPQSDEQEHIKAIDEIVHKFCKLPIGSDEQNALIVARAINPPEAHNDRS